MKAHHIFRISAAVVGLALLAGLTADPASASHRRHHRNHHDYDYHYDDYPCGR